MKDVNIVKKDPLTTIWSLAAYFGSLLALFLVSEFVFAGGGGASDVGTLATGVANKLSGVVQLITAGSYVAGVAFALMGLLKLKAHKEQPTQVQLSQPIVLLIIAACLIFLPFVIQSAGATIWGTTSSGTSAQGITSVTQ